MKRIGLLQRGAVASLGLVLFLALLPGCPLPPVDPETAYQNALADAAVAEPDEIVTDLIPIVAYNDYLVWKGEAEDPKVLVVMWTDWAGYDNLVGQMYATPWDFWVTAVPELQDFCKDHWLRSDDLPLRMEQLLGLPPNDGKDRFVEFWVDPDDLYRPSPDPEITDREAELDFPGSAEFLTVSEDHIQWFNDLMAISYGEGGYPWTRLGYTYDWGNPCSEVGLSEFIIQAGATVEVEAVTSTEDYCLWW